MPRLPVERYGFSSTRRTGSKGATWSAEHLMRLDIYGQFIVNVVKPKGGCSKGRPIAFIEESDRWSPVDLLIPNDLGERAIEHYVADRFSAFARPGTKVRRLDGAKH